MKKKHSIYLMYAIALLQGMVFYAPVATLYRRAQGVSLFEISVIESLSILLIIVLEIPWGYVADRIGYKKTLVICNILYVVSKVLFWQATGFGWFLAERLMLSVIFSGLSGCDSAYMFVLAGEEDSHRAFGVYSAMSNVGLIVAAVVFSAVATNNYRLAGLLTVISYSAAMLLTLLLHDVEPTAKRSHANFLVNIRGIAVQAVADKRFFLFLIATTLMNESCNYIAVFASQLQYIRAGIPVKLMGYLYIIVALSSLSAAYSGRVMAFLGEKKMFCLLLSIAGVACAILTLTASPLLSIGCIVLLRGSVSLFMPACMKVQNSRIKTADRATMLSVYACIMDTGAVFSNLAFGRAADINIAMAMGMGMVFCFCALGVYLRYKNK